MSQYYETSDMYLGVTLVALGYVLENIERTENSSRAVFLFTDSNSLMQAVESYWKKTLLLEPQSLFVAYKQTKNRLNQVSRYGQ